MSSSSSDAPIKSTPNSPNFNYKTCKRCGKVRHILHQENDDDNDAGENCEDWNPNKDCFSPSLIMHPTMNDIIKRAKNFCADNTIVILNDVPKTPYRSATTKSLEKHKFDKLKQSGVKKLLQSIGRRLPTKKNKSTERKVATGIAELIYHIANHSKLDRMDILFKNMVIQEGVKYTCLQLYRCNMSTLKKGCKRLNIPQNGTLTDLRNRYVKEVNQPGIYDQSHPKKK